MIHVAFTDGREADYAVVDMPFSTGPIATDVRVIADGDAIEIMAPTGDFEATADELAALADEVGFENTDLAQKIGAAIRRLRQGRGMILRDVEALTGIAVPNLSALEAGRSLPRLDTLARIARALHTTIADLATAPPELSTGRYWGPPERGRQAPTIYLSRSPYKFRFYNQERESEHRERLEKQEGLFPDRAGRHELYLWLDEAFDAVDDLRSLWTEILTSYSQDVAKDEQLTEAMVNLGQRVDEMARLIHDRDQYQLRERD